MKTFFKVALVLVGGYVLYSYGVGRGVRRTLDALSPEECRRLVRDDRFLGYFVKAHRPNVLETNTEKTLKELKQLLNEMLPDGVRLDYE